MIRVIFVDDEPNILAGLKRMLRSQRHEWDMEFAGGGDEALALMEAKPFDVVVSDMKMPGTDGVALLNETKARYPESIRIVLSGQADREAIVNVVGATHQYLSKPCEPEVLKATIDRAYSLRTVLTADRLKSLVSQISTLPSLPSLYQDIMAELNKTDPSLARVGEIIQSDPGMSTKVLALVNSAYFGLKRSVASVEHAVSLLGLDTITTLVLGAGIFEQFDNDPAGLSLDTLWQHSLRVSRFASAIAKLEGLEKNVVSETFTAGMLHDIGTIVLATNNGEEYVRMVEMAAERQCDMAVVEREVIGATHGEVGAYLMGLWGLPDGIVEAVAYHSIPSDCPVPTIGPLAIVHVSDILAHGANPMDVDPADSHLDQPFLDSLGLSDRWPVWQAACAELEASGTGA